MQQTRCSWCGDDPLYVDYHDNEWGVPVRDDQRMFEFLVLESFQAGLSWITILRKRENFRVAFANFDPQAVAVFTEADVERLLQDKGIVRNQAKIRAAIHNAQVFLAIQKEFGSFCAYIWSYVDGKPIQNAYKSLKEVPATTELATQMSKDFKKRGFKFLGPTVMYAHMQAAGLVNDHLVNCPRYTEVQEL